MGIFEMGWEKPSPIQVSVQLLAGVRVRSEAMRQEHGFVLTTSLQPEAFTGAVPVAQP